MNPLIESMQSLQRLVRAGAFADQTAQAREIAGIRAQVPAPVLAHFDRMIAQGRKGVAEVHHGVCGACHLKLPGFMIVPRIGHDDLQLCDHCGAYLVFVSEAAETLPPAVRAPQKRRYRAAAAM